VWRLGNPARRTEYQPEERAVAFVEISLENVLPTWTTLSDGRRAIVIEESPGSGALLILPAKEAWEAVHLLHVATGRMYPEIRAAQRGEVHAPPPGVVIVAPPGAWPSGPG
jgi:hypothetical protein